MKSKTSLSLIEQVIMIAVFAVAAAISIRIFVYADNVSKKAEIQDFAVTEVQNAAEVIKNTKGDLEKAAEALNGSVKDGKLTVGYNGDFEKTELGPVYILTAEKTAAASELTGSATIEFKCGEESIFSLRVCWQEGAE